MKFTIVLAWPQPRTDLIRRQSSELPGTLVGLKVEWLARLVSNVSKVFGDFASIARIVALLRKEFSIVDSSGDSLC